MAKKPTLNDWQKRQAKDPYVLQAKQQGYRSRAAFKLIEMQEKKRIFQPGMRVLELGAAPGGWSQLIVDWIAPHGQLDAVDLLPMYPLPNVQQHIFDIESDAFTAWLQASIAQTSLDWLVSDMAPNMSGHRTTDQLRSISLAETCVSIALRYAQAGSGLLIKTFQGEGLIELSTWIKKNYKTFAHLKPKASERSSREVYLYAIGKNT